MKKYFRIMLCVLFVFCLFGCGGRETGAAETELDLRHGYWELNSLCGYGVADVNRLLGEELTFVEVNWDTTDSYVSSEGHIYYFWKDADALYRIDYMEQTIEEAYEMAKQSHDALVPLYGDDYPGSTKVAIHDLESAQFLQENYKPQKAPEVKQYTENWPVPYNQRMEQKVKDILDLEKVSVSVIIRTPAFMRGLGKGENFSVSFMHYSMPQN